MEAQAINIKVVLDYLELSTNLGCDNSLNFFADSERLADLVLSAHEVSEDDAAKLKTQFKALDGIVSAKDGAAYLCRNDESDELYDAVANKKNLLTAKERLSKRYIPYRVFDDTLKGARLGTLSYVRQLGVMKYLGLGTQQSTEAAVRNLIACAYYSDCLAIRLLCHIDKASADFWLKVENYLLDGIWGMEASDPKANVFIKIMDALKLKDGAINMQLVTELIAAKTPYDKKCLLEKLGIKIEGLKVEDTRKPIGFGYDPESSDKKEGKK